MKFTSVAEIVKGSDVITLSEGGKRMYPTLFKRSVAEYIKENPKLVMNQLAEKTGINSNSLTNWVKQYDEGLLSIEGSFSVSRHSLVSNAKILKGLKRKIQILQKQSDAIELCETLGIKIANVEKIEKVMKMA